MRLGKIIGNVVATRKDERLNGKRLLLMQPMRSDRTPAGSPIVVLDSVGAGASEFVLWVSGKEACNPFGVELPVDACVVGIVDQTHVVR
ncbi:EutN/CcmL family microcompartment protein [bacterium]|nr:EutN/CcmL family microcompartment protein [bacterium]